MSGYAQFACWPGGGEGGGEHAYLPEQLLDLIILGICRRVRALGRRVEHLRQAAVLLRRRGW
jgi:hypothetical protein